MRTCLAPRVGTVTDKTLPPCLLGSATALAWTTRHTGYKCPSNAYTGSENAGTAIPVTATTAFTGKGVYGGISRRASLRS